MLNDDQITQYHEEGYVIPDYRLPDSIIEEMRSALEVLITSNPDLSADSLFVPHLAQDNPQGLRSPNADSWLSFARHEKILTMVSQLIGDDIALWGTTVFGKPAGNGKATPWHQDGQYWPIRPLASCTAWIAIDDVKVENGCMRVIPGSHKKEQLLAHHLNISDGLTLNQELDEDQYDEEKAVDIVLKPGQMSFHDINLVHGSGYNTSNKRRAGYVLRFMPTTSHFDRELGRQFEKNSKVVNFSERALYLVRGKDKCGLNDFNVGHISS